MRRAALLATLLVATLLVPACGGGGSSTLPPHDAGHGGGDGGTTADGSPGSDAQAAHDGPGAGSDATGDTGSGSGDGGAGDASGPARPLIAYASGYGPDIQWLAVDPATGALSASGELAAFGAAPSFLAVDTAGEHLYAVDESAPGRVGAYSIDATTGALTFQNAVPSGGDGPPYVGLDPLGKWALVANYTSGSASVLPVKADGSLGAATATVSAGSLAHMTVADPSDAFVFVPCLGSDWVAQYVFDAAAGTLTPNSVPHMATAKGAGPRHLAFHPDGKLAYLVDETASTVSELALDAAAGTLSIVHTVSTLPPGFTGTSTAAEVHVHPSGKWLFTSNRGDDSIAVFPLDAQGAIGAPTFTKSGGATPRDFSLDPAGTHLYVANQGAGDVVAF
ncbi:MAG: lactonase family protein, partial [Polyangiaceae bacterium]